MTDYTFYRTALFVVNSVLNRMGVSQITNLGETAFSITLVELLNDVLNDLNSAAHWPTMYAETSIAIQSSVAEYKLNIKAQNIEEVAVSGRISPLQMVEREEIRRLSRIRSFGRPSQVCITRVSSLSPYVRLYPTPNTNSNLDIAYYSKVQTIRASAGDNDYVIPFPSRSVIAGLYAAAVLEENGNQQSTEVVAAYKLYQDFRAQDLAAFEYDTGAMIQIVPTGYPR